MKISKREFEGEEFRDMLQAAGEAGAGGGGKPEKVPVLSIKGLSMWVKAEFDVFILFLKYIFSEKIREAKDNTFAQGIHDGGTLDNKTKYQVFGSQFIGMNWSGNYVLALGLQVSLTNTDSAVGVLFGSTFKKRTGFNLEDVVGSMISDGAARGVSSEFDLEEEVCLMHDDDKLGQSAVGSLTRSRKKIVVNPFDEGNRLMALCHCVGTHFSYSTRLQELHKLGESVNAPSIRIQIDYNGTRKVASHQNVRPSFFIF